MVSPDQAHDHTEGAAAAICRLVSRALEALCTSTHSVLLILTTNPDQRETVLRYLPQLMPIYGNSISIHAHLWQPAHVETRAVAEFPWSLTEEQCGRIHLLAESTDVVDTASATAALLVFRALIPE